MSSSSSKMIMVRSFEGEIFEINETVALESQTIKNIMEDESVDHSVIPLPKVTASVLSKIIEYLKKHMETREKVEDLKSFDAEFVKVDNTALVDLIQAANYLKIKSLVDLTVAAAADLIRGKTTEEMREIFNIVNDFTPEEEEKVRLENAWAF